VSAEQRLLIKQVQVLDLSISGPTLLRSCLGTFLDQMRKICSIGYGIILMSQVTSIVYIAVSLAYLFA